MSANHLVDTANDVRRRKPGQNSAVPGPGSINRLNLKMAERFKAWLAAQKYASSTQERYYRVATKLCHYLGRKALSSVTPMDIGDFLTHTLPSRWTDGYVSDQLGTLRSFFDFLYLGGVVGTVAPRFLKARPRLKPLPKVLTEAQVRKLIRVAKNPRDRALIEILYATGCRVGEICRARVEAIDFKGHKFQVRGKRKDRIVYFGTKAAKSLRSYLQGRKTGYLFQDKIEQQKGYITYYKKAWIGNWKEYRLGRKGAEKHCKWLGNPSVVSYAQAQRRFRTFLKQQKIDLTRYKPDRPLNRSTLNFVVRELARRAGLGKIGPHTLRHSFATHLLDRGADIRAIQELLGHTCLTSTQIYTRVSNRNVKSAFHKFHPRG